MECFHFNASNDTLWTDLFRVKGCLSYFFVDLLSFIIEFSVTNTV